METLTFHKPFHTRKLGEISVFFAVNVDPPRLSNNISRNSFQIPWAKFLLRVFRICSVVNDCFFISDCFFLFVRSNSYFRKHLYEIFYQNVWLKCSFNSSFCRRPQILLIVSATRRRRDFKIPLYLLPSCVKV